MVDWGCLGADRPRAATGGVVLHQRIKWARLGRAFQHTQRVPVPLLFHERGGHLQQWLWTAPRHALLPGPNHRTGVKQPTHRCTHTRHTSTHIRAKTCACMQSRTYTGMDGRTAARKHGSKQAKKHRQVHQCSQKSDTINRALLYRSAPFPKNVCIPNKKKTLGTEQNQKSHREWQLGSWLGSTQGNFFSKRERERETTGRQTQRGPCWCRSAGPPDWGTADALGPGPGPGSAPCPSAGPPGFAAPPPIHFHPLTGEK